MIEPEPALSKPSMKSAPSRWHFSVVSVRAVDSSHQQGKWRCSSERGVCVDSLEKDVV